jgi:hypothetical protein
MQEPKLQLFGVHWLRNGVLVQKDAVAATNADGALAIVREREPRMLSLRRRERRPDSFRLTDATGAIVGVFRILSTEPLD